MKQINSEFLRVLTTYLSKIRTVRTSISSTNDIMVMASMNNGTTDPIYLITYADLQGAAPVPVVRTNNPIIGTNTSNANVDALDAAIGADNTPIARTNNPTVINTTINAKVDALDAAIGVTPTSTNIVVAASSVNANLSAIDAKIGPTTAGAKSASVTAAAETGNTIMHRTVLTGITLTEVVTLGGVEVINDLIYTFPEGGIVIHGAMFDGTVVSTAAGEANSTELALGSAAAAAAAELTGTEVDLCAKTTHNMNGVTAVDHENVAAPTTAFFDGHATAAKVYLNVAPAAASAWDAAGTITFAGSVTLLWSFVGDF
jgi:hypothetical protein